MGTADDGLSEIDRVIDAFGRIHALFQENPDAVPPAFRDVNRDTGALIAKNAKRGKYGGEGKLTPRLRSELKEIRGILMSVLRGSRLQEDVLAILDSTVMNDYGPDADKADRAAKILRRKRIRSREEFDLARERLDEIEGNAASRAEVDALRALCDTYEFGSRAKG